MSVNRAKRRADQRPAWRLRAGDRRGAPSDNRPSFRFHLIGSHHAVTMSLQLGQTSLNLMVIRRPRWRPLSVDTVTTT